MKQSTDRFLTTHTGSLPRPDDLVRMMFAKEEGVPVENEALTSRIRSAIAEVVQKQAAAGIDIGDDDLDAVVEEPLCASLADAACRAGDGGDLAG